MMTEKRSQTQVVATVLLILITVVLVVVVFTFLTPFVNKQLEGSGCLKVSEQVLIQNNIQYTCY